MIPRERFAAVCLAAFLGGGILAPVAHLATHRHDHTHAAGTDAVGLGVPAAAHAPHRHGGHETEGNGPARAANGPVPTLPHGQGSLAHLALALLAAPPAMILPAPAAAGRLPPPLPTQPASRLQVCFPLPRPPPAAPIA